MNKYKIDSLFIILITLILNINYLVQSEEEEKNKIHFIYIHGANSSEEGKEKEFANSAKTLHKAINNAFSTNEKMKKFLNGDIMPESHYIYWGDLVRDDSQYFKHQIVLTKSKGIAQKFRSSIQPIVYDALWIQDIKNNRELLDRMHTAISAVVKKDKNAKFVLISHSAGTLASYDYLSHRLAMFDLNQYLEEKYGAKTQYQVKSKKVCLSLLNKYGLSKVSASSPSVNPAFVIARNLGNTLDKLIYESKSAEIEEIKKLATDELKTLENFLIEEKNISQDTPLEDEFYTNFITNLEGFINACKINLNQISSLLNIEQIIEKKKNNINNIKAFSESINKKLENKKLSLEAKNRLKQRQNLAKKIIAWEEQGLQKLISLKNSPRIKAYLEATAESQEIIKNMKEDIDKLCIPEEKFKGLITMGSPLSTFRSQEFQRLSSTESASYKFLELIFRTNGFWFNYNHQGDIVGVAIDQDLINNTFAPLYPNSKGIIASGEDFSKSASFFACRNIEESKCAHVWYFKNSSQLANGLVRLYLKEAK